jgi:signal peptidase II
MKNRAFGLALAAAIFALDQWIKGYVSGPLDLRNVGVIEIVSFFDLNWTPNFGVSLGLLTAGTPEMRWALVGVTALIACFVLIWMLRERALADIVALAMVLGGALGNILDRVKFGYVVDYADLHFGTFRPFLVFNLADAAITIGVLIILARSLLSREKPAKTEADIVPES